MLRYGGQVLFCALAAAVAAAHAQAVDLDAEIARVKREISQVRAERERNRAEAAQDRADFAAYQERAAARRRSLAAEADSVSRVVAEYGRRRDSLAAAVGVLEAQKRQTELLQSALRGRIIAACEALSVEAARLSPGVARPSMGALSFLAADCKGKNIDNVEALNRLAQILQNIEEASSSIDISQVPSPVPQLAGSVSNLRIGAVFEAVVDEKGERCAIWCGHDSSGAPQWRFFNDRQIAGSLRQAVDIREGKAIPAFVDIPFGHSCAGGSP